MKNKEYNSSFNLNETQARELAQEVVDRESKNGGLVFAIWKGVSLKNPVVVRTVHGEPSYWFFPVEIDGAIVGFARVLGNGRVAHVGSFSISSDSKGLTVVTGLTQDGCSKSA